MQSQIAAEEGNFTAADVIAGIEAKIRRRHPHVFADAHISSADEVLVRWDQIKAAERGANEPVSALDHVPAALPALARAQALTSKAAELGADYPTLGHVIAQVRLRVEALMAADNAGERTARLGDLLLVLAEWARWLDVDPEIALRNACERFEERFRSLEELAAKQGKEIGELSSVELSTLRPLSRWEAR
jgi:MazG family protein